MVAYPSHVITSASRNREGRETPLPFLLHRSVAVKAVMPMTGLLILSVAGNPGWAYHSVRILRINMTGYRRLHITLSCRAVISKY